MSAPRLVLHIRSDQELGLFTREEILRDQELLRFYRVPGGREDDRYLRSEQFQYVRSAADLHCLIRHSCEPSAYVDWQELALRALRSMHEGEEITLNYLTMYEVVENPFLCHCGSEQCYREVRGFRYLSMEQQMDLELYLSPYLRGLLHRQALASRANVS